MQQSFALIRQESSSHIGFLEVVLENRHRFLIILGTIAGITLGHYLVAIQLHHYHDIFRRLYYLPIILGGLWFQLRGGLATTVIVSMVYAPHVAFQWGSHPDAQWEQYLEIILYNIIGVVTGILSRREYLQRVKAENTAQSLEKSFQKLKEQAKQILTFEEQLLRASRLSALGELAAGLAHEIRNPLGSIRGTAEIVNDPSLSKEQRSEFGAILIREVDRLNQVVTNFLSFAKPAPVSGKSFDLNRLVKDLVKFSAAEYQRNRISVEMNLQEVQPVSGDSDQIKQVILNVLLNAAQAMPEGGRLIVSTSQRENYVSVKISDTGPGIPPEILPKIFNPFFTTRNSGTGLGLAISQRIVQAHGGQIEVQSAPGKGTSLEVSLPFKGTEE